MNWFYEARPSLPAASSHHQTLLGKALYEHGDCKTIAAVASSSCSIQNSSLGPNLLALIRVEGRTLPLFASIFLLDDNNNNSTTSSSSTLQFTTKLSIYIENINKGSISPLYGKLMSSLLVVRKTSDNKKSYFEKSLQELAIQIPRPVSNSPQLVASILNSFIPSSFCSTSVFQSLKKLTLTHFVWNEIIQNMATTFPYLEEFTCFSSSLFRDIEINNFRSFSKLSKTLTSLNLAECRNLCDAHLEAIFFNKDNNSSTTPFPKLASLNLQSCKKLTDAALRCVSANCANLNTLNLYDCIDITDAGIQAIAANCLNLKSLNLFNNGNITDVGVHAISANLTNLTYLNLFRCDKFTEAGILSMSTKLGKLTFLDLSICNVLIPETGFQPLANLTQLTSLSLQSCQNFTDVALQPVCTSLSDLTYLNISCCWNITGAELIEAVSKLTKLKVLKIGGVHHFSSEDKSAMRRKVQGLRLDETI